MIVLPELKPYSERYGALDAQPLEIVCELMPDALCAGYDPVALDNLLARAVVMEATLGRITRMGYSAEALYLPVPLQCLWRSDDGLPLWAATYFVPTGGALREHVFRHKRQFDGRWTKTKTGTWNIPPTVGRWMERRVPLPAVQTVALRAMCIGNREEIERLLSGIVQIGKGRSMGLGEVMAWSVRPCREFSLVDDRGRLLRAIPEAAADVLPRCPASPTTLVGWTPPQWKRCLFLPGWPFGTEIGDGRDDQSQ